MLLFDILLIMFFLGSGALYIAISKVSNERLKQLALAISLINVLLLYNVYIAYENASINYQFVNNVVVDVVARSNLYLGIDGINLFFVLLTAIITPIVIISSWNSIKYNTRAYMLILLLLDMLLIIVFLVLDNFTFYIFFESILIPLFLLIGIYGAHNRVRASFYLFIYTLLGSLFLLISILYIIILIGGSSFDIGLKTDIKYSIQIFLFCGIFLAFAVKTPVIFLNNWLLKAHVESPLGGSIILAAIVLKLSLYGIFRLILPILPQITINYNFFVYMIGIITILYASISTLRTVDIKELIAYSSVCHAAVYLLAAFSNSIQGLNGSILLGLAHGLISSGLFICVGGVLYDRTHTRLISIFRGLVQIMPLFSILFFIFSLANAGTPLSLNFLGEFLSLFSILERSPSMGIIACSSIIFSASYSIFTFNRIVFGGSYSRYIVINLKDLTKREFTGLLPLSFLGVFLGIYPAPILSGLNYSVGGLLF